MSKVTSIRRVVIALVTTIDAGISLSVYPVLGKYQSFKEFMVGVPLGLVDDGFI